MEFYLICLTLPFHHRTSRFYLLDTLYCCHLWNYLPGNLRTEDLSLSFIKKRCGDFYKKNSLRASSPGRSGGWAVKEEELATTSLEFEYLHRKSRCEMLIGGDDISNDVITLGTCFSMFVYIRARFRFALIGGNLTAQSTGSHREIGGGIQIPKT